MERTDLEDLAAQICQLRFVADALRQHTQANIATAERFAQYPFAAAMLTRSRAALVEVEAMEAVLADMTTQFARHYAPHEERRRPGWWEKRHGTKANRS